MILKLKDLSLKENTACTIGNYDGIHKGHQEILRKLKEIAKDKNLKTVVITFYPHPKKILNPSKYKCLIVNLETKVDLLKKENIDYILIVDFNKQFYQKSPEEFLKFLKEYLNCRALVVGKDWRFGYGAKGDINLAKELSKDLDYEVFTIEDVKDGDKRVSSSEIRKYLKNGDVGKVKEFLGRDYYLIEKVVEGDKKGREIGFPTLNLKPEEDVCLKKGVYAGYVCFREICQKAVINYGNRPTVDGKKTFMEAHIIEDYKISPTVNDYIKVIFKHYIREEKQFKSVEDLKNQIKLDIEVAKNILGEGYEN